MTLRLQKLRSLDLLAPPQPGRPAHLSAASGLVRVGKFLYVVADDEYHLGIFPAHGGAPGVLLRLQAGDLPDDYAQRKARKPDLEALVKLPQFDDFPHGALLALGSGSRRNRRAGFLMELDEQGAVITTPRMLNLATLFAAMDECVEEINIEGAVAVGNRLRLLQRGNKTNACSALIDFDLHELLHSLRNERDEARATLLQVTQFDLGEVSGVPLSFSDAAALPDGSIVFSAIAEDTSDSYADGRFLGAVIGRIDAQDVVGNLHALQPPQKIEGIAAAIDGQRIELLLTTDADDALVPAALYRAALPL